MYSAMEGEMKNRTDVPQQETSPRWILIFSTLLISLLLWGAIIVIGQEMFKRLDREIAQGLEAFR